jgi:internalin A
LLVGEGNVGKTSLLAALRDFPFIEGRATTHGIEIQLLKLRHPDLGVDMTVRVWDFGGQEVYRISHQFFFSRRALYPVVWNAREGQEQNEVEGWLRRIRLRVDCDARSLVVATHCEERYPELDYPQLKYTFPELLAGQYKVDNRTERGISELRAGIATEAARLPQMGQLISRRWMTARDEILALAETDPQIHYGQFVDVCKRHHLDDAEIVTLAELMHDLGQIVYYGSDEGLRDFVVLDPVLSFQPELDRLHSDVADVKSSINDLMAHAADTADAIRRIQRAVTTEITDVHTFLPWHRNTQAGGSD